MATIKANDNTALCSIWAGLAEVESQSCSHLANERAVHSVGTGAEPPASRPCRSESLAEVLPDCIGIIGCDQSFALGFGFGIGVGIDTREQWQNISHGHRITSFWSKA